MKKLLFTFTMSLLWLGVKAQTPYYHYYEGEKRYFSLNTEYAFLSLKEQKLTDDIQRRNNIKATTLHPDISDQKQSSRGEKRFYTMLHFEEKLSDEQYLELLSDIKKRNKDVIISPYFKSKNNDKIGLSNFFYVKLKKESDTILLKKMTEQTKSIIIEQNQYCPLSFLLSTTEFSKYSSMECANIFYESSLFQAANPDLMVNLFDNTSDRSMAICVNDPYNLGCVNDPHFNVQWGLRNTDGNHPGIDIKACEAWQLSTGSNVVVAIIDDGIKLDHLDLEANIHPLSYDVFNGSSPQILREFHGTRCAGVLGAVQNNNEGLSGVAPNCEIMSISCPGLNNSPMPSHPWLLANGIDWAWENGADVISNSWSHDDFDVTPWPITDAINRATTLGRGGKGCVVVHSAGNIIKPNINHVLYPATLPNVIAVGAIRCNGERHGSSRYGNHLNVVAPGENIFTTEWDGGYRNNFEYTSSACPHVSGIAALILSVKPELNWQQVRYAIESTCQKVNEGIYYPYNQNPNYPNGTWNNELGYGLVNAYAAVHSVLCSNNLPIVSGAITQNTTWNTNMLAIGTITIQSGATLTITSQVKCENSTSIVVEPGGKLILNGGTLTAACPNKMWKGIVVLGDTTHRQLPQYQGSIELKNNAIIEHALCAISAAPAGYSNAGGGIITAINTTFRNNLQTIDYSPYENKNSSNNIIDNIGKFTNCTFTINGSNRFATNGKTFQNHVRMYRVRGVTFKACTFENATTTPRLGKGIYTEDAGFKIINDCSASMPFPYIDCTCPKNNSTPCNFTNFNIGIHSVSTGGTPRPIYIDQSKFEINATGVQMNAQPNFRLTRCDFINMYNRGLYSVNSSGYRIEENNFTNFTTPNVITDAIYMSNSGVAENRIYKNSFNNLSNGGGICINGANGIGPRMSGLQFVCNEFSNNFYDIYIYASATVRPYQGGLSAGADNTFENTQTRSIYSLGSSPQTITYYYNPITTNPGGVNRTPYNPTSNIILDFALGNPCASTFCLPGGSRGPDFRSDLDSLAQYQSMQSHYDQLLAALGENPELLQALLVLSDAMRELSDHAISRILHDSILYLDALKSWYEVVRTPIAKYWLSEVYASEKNYEQAEAILREIPRLFAFSESELIEHENYMQFYNFKKQMYPSGKDWHQLNEAEIAQLQRIAEATHGRSAGMAKGALCFFFDICYEYEPESPPFGGTEGGLEGEKAEGKKAESNDLHYELDIYPNPTSSEMTVTLNNSAVKIVQMEVYDLTNRKIYQQTVNQSYSTLRLNELAQGVYILKVYLDQGDVVIRKVVKQ